MFYFVKGTEPHSDYGYDLDSVFKEEQNVINNSDENIQSNEKKNSEDENNLDNENSNDS